MHRSPAAVRRPLSDNQRNAFQTLYRQQSDKVWNADKDIDWSSGPQIPEHKRESWLRMINVFLGLEVMGLDTIQIMMSKATHKLRDPNLNLYLAAQTHDEARHVYVLDKYLTLADGHGRMSRLERGLIDRFGNMASFGLFRVENWLTSTLFSENFAALFLQKILEIDDTDPLAKQIFRNILRDEVRHVNFLHTVLPDLIGDLPSFGRTYVWQSQLLMIGTVALGLRRIKGDAAVLGLDIEDFKATLIANLDQQFKDAGIDEFLHASSYARVINRFV
jgi:bacterioferritin (cytochrome b1)